MTVASGFSTAGHTASSKRDRMILPQREEGRHGAEVVGMVVVDDNTDRRRRGGPLGERLGKVVRDWGILRMRSDQGALERGLAEPAAPGADGA